MKKNKLKPGRKINTIASLERHIKLGRWIYLNHKPLHYGWITSMQYRTLSKFVYSGMVRVALENE